MFNQINDLGLPIEYMSKTVTFINIQTLENSPNYVPVEYFAEGIILRPPVAYFSRKKEPLKN
jgi:hypothetical protein